MYNDGNLSIGFDFGDPFMQDDFAGVDAFDSIGMNIEEDQMNAGSASAAGVGSGSNEPVIDRKAEGEKVKKGLNELFNLIQTSSSDNGFQSSAATNHIEREKEYRTLIASIIESASKIDKVDKASIEGNLDEEINKLSKRLEKGKKLLQKHKSALQEDL